MTDNKDTEKHEVETTGHVWDDDLREYNNPLPNWWLWTFYATIIFAVVYWILYPAWPVGDDYTKGVKTVTVTDEEGNELYSGHWNTRARLIDEMQNSASAQKQREYLESVSQASYEEILSDPDKMAFARSMGKVMFADNCAGCHGSGGQGVMPYFPNLVDDAWLWGGSVEKIEQTLLNGRQGNMPGFAQIQGQQAQDLAAYVLSLSGHEVDAGAAQRGKQAYNVCMGCHGADGTGNTAMGAANLTDSIWTYAQIPDAANLEEKKAMIKDVIQNGIQREMPAFGNRLSKEEIKMLTAYVHELGGGQ